MGKPLSDFLRYFSLIALLVVSALVLQRSDVGLVGVYDQTRSFTRNIEFDYVDWTLDALGQKLAVGAVKSVDYLPQPAQHDLVIAHTQLLAQIRQLEGEINQVYADPNIPDAPQRTATRRAKLEEFKSQRDRQAPLVEAIIQQQVREILKEYGLTSLGQEFPPVLFQVTSLPRALIVSPRDVIRQDVNLSLMDDLGIEAMVDLEREVEQGLNVSALVVPIGGVGIYPTMVMSTTDLNWLMEVVTHEWIHNYLTLRPLGVRYFETGELRTMNETTASLAGKELGQALIARFYPELMPMPAAVIEPAPQLPEPTDPPRFDFRAEMHETRVKVDEMLAAGQVEEAERFMEQRRQRLWENGYQIRRLNQAYFAFYGAYADGGGGEAGEDPVGPAVVKLREASGSLAEFLQRISQMTSFAELEQAVALLP